MKKSIFSVEMVDIAKLKPAPYNPPTRTSEGALKDLKSSIEEIGLVYPLVVNNKFEIIDGHRRLAVLRELGHTSIPVFFRNEDKDVVFENVNRAPRKLKSSEELFVYLSGGPVSQKSMKKISALEQIVGRQGLEVICENKLSPNSLLITVSVLKSYLNREDGDRAFWKKAIMWIVNHQQQFAVRVALSSGIDPKIIVNAIETNMPIL